MIKIEYTEEMKKQDELFEITAECMDTMERLHKEIMQQAVNQGYDKYVLFHRYDNEHVTEIYESYQDWYNENFYDENGKAQEFEEASVFSTCNQLIEFVTKEERKEERINNGLLNRFFENLFRKISY